MIPFLLLASLFASPSLDPAWVMERPGLVSANHQDRGDTSEALRWAGSGRQFLAGSAGAAFGAGGGAFVGGLLGMMVGKAVYGDPEQTNCGFFCFPDWFGVMIVGGMVGGVVGDMSLTGLFVKMSASPDYPSSSVWPAVWGAGLGFGGGLALGLYGDSRYDQTWMPYVGGIVGSSLGAVVLDRWMAVDPRQVALSPWSPRPGLNGARLSLTF